MYSFPQTLTSISKTIYLRNITRTKKLTISDIAYHLGYQDPLYFSKHFKKVFHISPTEFMKYSSENGEIDVFRPHIT
ncbi:MAG: helix-turn-helix domain-containing protein [Eubacteriales bacterium]